MSQELNKYLRILIKESSRFERTDINNKVNESFRAKYGLKLVFLIITLALIFLLKSGFSNEFISFVSSVLSILVGLFITALIFSFDKFYEPNKSEETNSRIKLWDTQAYNYAKKFAYITSKTIVVSIVTLVALILSTLFKESFDLNLFEYTFIDEKDDLFESILTGIILVSNFIQRFIVIYFLLRIMYNPLFIVTSMVQYMTTKIDRM